MACGWRNMHIWSAYGNESIERNNQLKYIQCYYLINGQYRKLHQCNRLRHLGAGENLVMTMAFSIWLMKTESLA
jgi:hypothetical protein